MKAIILSAGQGKRLLPLTQDLPKCAVPVNERALIDWQIDALVANGIDRIVVVTGFGAGQVDRLLSLSRQPVQATTIFNPRFDVADNLISCWVARREMGEDFVLLNGDTVFEPRVLERLLAAPQHPAVIGIDRKAHYDDDDMKVRLERERLLRVGKDLPLDEIDGESIGMMVFRGNGPSLFRDTLERAACRTDSDKRWYLSVLDEMAGNGLVRTQSVEGLDWAEVDYPLDLMRASAMVGAWTAQRNSPARSGRA